MKCDIKIYGIEERSENILENKKILGLSDDDIFIAKKGRRTPKQKWPYTACKKAFTQPIPEGVTHRLVLQDDVSLAPDFLKYLQLIIEARPDDIIMMTALDFREKNEYVESLKSPYVEVGQFVSGDAVLIPVKYIDDVFKWMEETYPQIAIGNIHEDAAFKFYALRHNIKCITTVPSIVQHEGDKSSICAYKIPMKTYYFSNWEKANWKDSTLNKAYINVEEFNKYIAEENKESESDEIQYYVRTTGQRCFDYSPLKTINLYDYKHKPIESFIEQLEKISKYNSVLLEDDLVLCKNFQEEIEKAIAKFPGHVINFFEDPDVYETTFLRSFPFEWNQCTYYPKGVAKQIALQMKKLLPKFPEGQRLYSEVENLAMFTLQIPHVIYRPFLVQHNDIKSVLQEDRHRRDTLWFKDYLDEAGISYFEAYTPTNLKKLKDIRDKHIKECLEEFERDKELLKNE